MTPPVLYRIENLLVSLGGRSVLEVDGLEIAEGGVICLVGPNGAGKSVALALLAGLVEPGQGKVLYRERPLAELTAGGGLGREVTLVHQHPYLFRGSVLANVTCGMHGRNLSRKEKNRRGRELLARVGLAGFAGRPSVRLSAGETARAALARGLGCGAGTLLLDEPTAAIDRNGLKRIEDIIAAEADGGGKTVIMSTHSMDQAVRLAGSILYVREGKIFEWEPENILTGRVEARGHGKIFRSGCVAFEVGHTAPSGACSVGIGEGDIRLLPKVEGVVDASALRGRIVSLAGANGTVRATVDAGEHFFVRLSQEEAAGASLGIGSTVRVSIPPGKVRFIGQPSRKRE